MASGGITHSGELAKRPRSKVSGYRRGENLRFGVPTRIRFTESDPIFVEQVSGVGRKLLGRE
jgi:hypothetical protein